MESLRVVEPEGERYAADLLLLHGLWAAPTVWGRVAVGLAQRGWRCWLLDMRASAHGASGARGLEAWCDRARRALESLSSPPIVIGHDVGGLVALALAEAGTPRAAIAVAPLLCGIDPLVGRMDRWAARWIGRDVLPPPVEHASFQALGGEARAWLSALLAPEEGALVASIGGRLLEPGAPRVPALLVAQEADPTVPRALVEITGRGIEADVFALPGSHWPMAESRLDPWMTQLHRWIIRRVGHDLLLLRGDEDVRDE